MSFSGSEEQLKGRMPVSPKLTVSTRKPTKNAEGPPHTAQLPVTAAGDGAYSQLENLSISEVTEDTTSLPVPTSDTQKPRSQTVGALQFSDNKTEEDDSGSDSDATVNWEVSAEVVDFGDLREFAGTRKPRKKKRKRQKGGKDPEHPEQPGGWQQHSVVLCCLSCNDDKA